MSLEAHRTNEIVRAISFLAADEIGQTLGLDSEQTSIVQGVFIRYCAASLQPPSDQPLDRGGFYKKLAMAEEILDDRESGNPIDPQKFSQELRRKLREAGVTGIKPPDDTSGAFPNAVKPSVFTPREREVLGLIAQGKTNKEIGEDLHLLPNTVHSHARNVFKKGRFGIRTDAAVYLARAGFRVTPDDKDRPSITEITQR